MDVLLNAVVTVLVAFIDFWALIEESLRSIFDTL